MSDVEVRPGTTQSGRQPSARVRELVAALSLEEKLAQISGHWVDHGGNVVAPMADVMGGGSAYDDATRLGIGHLTRVFGTHPVEPGERRTWLHRAQRKLVESTPAGLPAIVHEECLNGLAAWRATAYPVPPAWGATFDPDLVEEMAAQIGSSMRELGVHQGLAPVLDVVRDARWGRVEECIAEDPYVVGALGTAYVRGLQSTGIIATLKHFVGYSNSRAGRNLAPVHAGPREIADVLLPPFEMALRDGGVRSVMHSYAEVDGLPAAADRSLLTDLLRGDWGFEGTVVADYFGIAFLNKLHAVATDLADAAHQALHAGIDVELPSQDAFGAPLLDAVQSGAVPVELVDLALERILTQKEELGLLDDRFDGPEPSGDVDLDPPLARELARRLAEESLVLVSNDGTLPLAADATGARRSAPARVAVVGPNADRFEALFGCYSFINHVLDHHPHADKGIEAPTVLEALRAELVDSEVTFARGCDVQDLDRSGFAEAVEVAEAADVVVLVAGDHAGLFGRGTTGEGCDVDSLELPGVQRELVEAVLATGKPVVLVLVTGRPYAVGWALERCAAVVQSFFPGEEGGTAIARVLAGAVAPSGRMPISMPRSAGSAPYSYLHPRLGGPSTVTNLDTTPPVAFGHGLTYTSFERSGLHVAEHVDTNGTITATVQVTNTGQRSGTDVVQLYAHDPVASVTRPVAQLVAFGRVDLEPGASVEVTFEVPTTRVAFSNRELARVVEPGDLELWVGPDCQTRETFSTTTLVGDVHHVTGADARLSRVSSVAVARAVVQA
ncbi:MAG: glycoside hydrolase family 3 C-terminal domain-containing protein [Actinomycetota bacterium]|nr:glycoside hydrolase family 3 C-terminal domain-containing protein [Actinomycetota bacterium]